MKKAAVVCAGLVPLLVAVVVHRRALDCGFVFDDHLAVENNADANSFISETLWDLWYHDFWGKALTLEDSNKSYRPLTILSFRLQHYVDGYFDAPHFHAANIVLHGLTSIAVFFLAIQMSVPLLPSLLGATYFAVHAVHVENVVGIVGRADILASLFSVTSLLCYIAGRDAAGPSIDGKGPPAKCSSLKSLVYFVAFICLASAGILSKEVAVGTLPAAGLLEVLRFPGWKRFIKRGFFLVSFLVCYLWLRAYLATPAGEPFSFARGTLSGSQLLRRAENPFAFLQGLSKVLSLNYLQAFYAGLLLAPIHLSAEWSYNCIPAVESLHDPRLLGVAALYIAAAAALYWGVKRFSAAATKTWIWFLAFFLMTYLPASNIIFTVGTLVAERLMYMPSITWCILLVWGCFSLCTTAVGRKTGSFAAQTIVVCLIGAMAYRTLQRIPDWDTDRTLFEAAVATCPNSTKMNLQIGQSLLEDDDNLERALYHFKRAQEIDPLHCDTNHAMGMYYIRTNNITGALASLRAALPCPYVNMKSFSLLQQVWSLLESSGINPLELQREKQEVFTLIQAWEKVGFLARERGASLIKMGRRDAGVAALRSGRLVAPSRCDLSFWLGFALGPPPNAYEHSGGPTPPETTRGLSEAKAWMLKVARHYSEQQRDLFSDKTMMYDFGHMAWQRIGVPNSGQGPLPTYQPPPKAREAWHKQVVAPYIESLMAFQRAALCAALAHSAPGTPSSTVAPCREGAISAGAALNSYFSFHSLRQLLSRMEVEEGQLMDTLQVVLSTLKPLGPEGLDVASVANERKWGPRINSIEQQHIAAERAKAGPQQWPKKKQRFPVEQAAAEWGYARWDELHDAISAAFMNSTGLGAMADVPARTEEEAQWLVERHQLQRLSEVYRNGLLQYESSVLGLSEDETALQEQLQHRSPWLHTPGQLQAFAALLAPSSYYVAEREAEDLSLDFQPHRAASISVEASVFTVVQVAALLGRTKDDMQHPKNEIGGLSNLQVTDSVVARIAQGLLLQHLGDSSFFGFLAALKQCQATGTSQSAALAQAELLLSTAVKQWSQAGRVFIDAQTIGIPLALEAYRRIKHLPEKHAPCEVFYSMAHAQIQALTSPLFSRSAEAARVVQAQLLAEEALSNLEKADNCPATAKEAARELSRVKHHLGKI